MDIISMNTESDLPEQGTATDTADSGPMTFAQGVSDIADLIEDPETDLQESAEADPAEQPDDELTSEEVGEEGEPEDVEEQAETEEGDGSEEYAGGRFAADNAKVKLDDGSTITIAELKRNNFFQRDYTKKTTELAAEREQVERTKSEVDQYAQQLDQFRDFAQWFSETVLPVDPGPYKGAPNDPVAWIDHQRRKEQYDAITAQFAQFTAAREEQSQQQRAQAQEQSKRKLQEEVAALERAFPALKDPAKGQAFWSRLEQGAQEHYGITPDLVKTIGDHRLVRVLHDALELRRLRAAAPKAKEQVQAKPKLVTSSKRGNPQAANTRDRQVRAERLRKTGDFAAGVQSLMDLDL